MVIKPRSLSPLPASVVPFLAALLVFAAGCSGGEDATTAQAKSVFEQTMTANQEYANYAITVAHDSRSPFARQKILELIQSDHYPTALAAVRSIQEDPPAESREPLQAVFTSKSGALKFQTAVALARLGDEQALDWLAQEIEAGTAVLNLQAALVLAENDRVDPLTTQLRKFMSSDNLDTRNEGYAMLGAIQQPWATKLLIEGLGNEHGEDREQAIIALGQTGEVEMANRIVRFNNTQGLVFATLEALGALGDPTTIPATRNQTKHDEKQVRLAAAVATMRLGDAETAVAVLEPLVADEDPAIRSLVAEKLAPVEGEQARQWLVALAQDEDKTVRLSALRSLATTARDQDATLFLAAAGDDEYEVATVALNVLSGLQASPEAIEQLIPLLEDKNPYVAFSAAHAILALQAGAQPAGS